MLLQCKNLYKNIGTTEILTNVSFTIETREKAALVGVNGAGKTSLFRLLTGDWQPDGGMYALAADTKIGYLPQGAWDEGGNSELSNKGHHSLYNELDSVFLPLKQMEDSLRALESSMGTLGGAELDRIMKKYDRLMEEFKQKGGYEQASRVRGVLTGLGFPAEDWEKPFNVLSGGQRTRASLGKLLLTSPDLLLLDEPTNHLDIDSVIWLEEYLRGYNGAVIAISHDRYFLNRVTTKTIEIEHKTSHTYNGNYSFYANKKAVDREIAFKHYFQQQKEIKHHEGVIKTLRSYKTEAAIIRAKSREKLLAKIERVEKPEEAPENMRLVLKPKIQSGNDVLMAENIRMGFGGATLFDGISFDLKRGERAAVIGPNGIGKTTLFKIIVGDYAPLSGNINYGVNVKIGYFDQSQQRLSKSKNIFEELADTYPRLTQLEIRNTLAAFVFIGDDVYKPISALSGGERGRVSLAKIMLGGANLLILDEPTNHLDMYSKEILESALRQYSGTLLYISHDRYFINNTATKIMEMAANGLTMYNGDYDYYVEKKKQIGLDSIDPSSKGAVSFRRQKTAQNNINGPSTHTDNSQKSDWIKKKEAESLERKKKARLERLENEIAAIEKKAEECNACLNQDTVAYDALALQTFYEEKIELEEKLMVLYDKWHIEQS